MAKNAKGLVAKRTQDPSHRSSTIVEYVPAPPSKSNRTVVNCSKCNKPLSFAGLPPIEVICTQCREKAFKEAQRRQRAEEATRTYKTCVTCGATFYIKAKKAAELKAAGLAQFTHCYACQKARDAAKAGQQ